MTTTETPPRTITHPWFCDPAGPCDFDGEEGVHVGHLRTLDPLKADVRLSVGLACWQEHDEVDPELVRLVVRDTAFTHLDGSPIVVEASLTPIEARQLAAMLLSEVDGIEARLARA